MKRLEDLTCLVVDNGLFVEQAVTLARTYKKVYYTVPGWKSGFPKMNDAKIGTGLENIEVVSGIFGDHFSSIDLFVFPDLYFGDEQEMLVSLGKKVWGARHGEEMEMYREDMKEIMEEYGLPVSPYRVISGVANLRTYLKQHGDKWVKTNVHRGTFETFYCENYKMIEPRIDEIEYQLGAFKHIIEFIVEDNLPDRVEVGTDGYTIDGKRPSVGLTGYEIKDLSYLGVFKKYSDLPSPITRFDRTMEPVFKEYGYRGFYSTEIRIGKDHEPYMIDFCSRSASPPNELYQEFYTNLAEIMWEGANGNMVDPEPISKYGCEVLIHSPWADKNWQPVDFDEKYRRNIKLRNACKINGRYYAIPQAVGLPEIGAVVGWGETVEEAVEMTKKIAESVQGFQIDLPVESLDKADEQIEMSKEFDLDFFD